MSLAASIRTFSFTISPPVTMASSTRLKSATKQERAPPTTARKPKKICAKSKAAQEVIMKQHRQKSTGTLLEEAFAKDKELRTACCRLTSVCSDGRLMDEIQHSVHDMRQIQMEAWHLVNLHSLRCLENGFELPDYGPTFFDHCLSGVASTAFTHLIEARDSVLWESIIEYRTRRQDAGLDEVHDRVGYGRLKSALRQHMVVNAGVMIRENFKKRLRAYVVVRFGTTDREASREEKAAKKRLVKQILRACYTTSETALVEALEIRDVLAEDGQPWSEDCIPWPNRIEQNMSFYVKLTWEFQRCVEGRMAVSENDKGIRAFSLFPVSKSFIGAFIDINGSTLAGFYMRIRESLGYNVLDDWDLPHVQLTYSSFVQNKRAVMRKCFSIDYIETRQVNCPLSAAAFRELPLEQKYRYASHLFANSISTDGYSASILYYRQKFDPPGDSAPVIPPKFEPDTLIGIDPGLRAVITAARENVAFPRPHRQRRQQRQRRRRRQRRRGKRRRGKRKPSGQRGRRAAYPYWIRRRREKRERGQPVEVVSVTSREYGHLAGFHRFRDWNETQKRLHPEYARVIHEMPTFKTASYSTYMDSLDYFWRHLLFLLRFSEERPYKKWRFFRKRMARSALDAIAARVVPIADRSRTCIAYGNWIQRSGIRGHPPSPVKKLKAAFEKRALVISMDEFMTSKLCSQCHRPLALVRYPTLVYPTDVEPPKRRRRKGKVLPRDTSLGETRIKVCYNVLRCENEACAAQYWNRDTNAAINILSLLRSLLQGHARMDAFQRR